MRDADHRLPVQLVQRVSDQTDACFVQPFGRLIKEQKLRVGTDAHRNQRTLAHAAAQGVGVLPRQFFFTPQMKAAHQLHRTGNRPFFIHAAMRYQRFANLKSNGKQRVHAVAASLRHIGDLTAANAIHLLGRKGEQALPVKAHVAADDSTCRKQAQHGEQKDALAASRFADDAEFIAGKDREGDLFNRLYGTAVGKADGNILNIQNRIFHRNHSLLCRP